jgi:hypothetical protein
MSIDMSSLVNKCIVKSTKYVLLMKEKLENNTEFSEIFHDKCVDVSNDALQILYDIRQIPWDKEILREKNYTNWEGIQPADVVQLQSVSDLMFHYLLEQSDYIPKQLTLEEQRTKMVSEHEWRTKQKYTFLRGVQHHFGIYPRQPSEGSEGSRSRASSRAPSRDTTGHPGSGHSAKTSNVSDLLH